MTSQEYIDWCMLHAYIIAQYKNTDLSRICVYLAIIWKYRLQQLQ